MNGSGKAPHPWPEQGKQKPLSPEGDRGLVQRSRYYISGML
ncbi:hypothetical protein SF06_20030 [Pseudomonas flexibilis]|nr:hypothetical protein SF06_20030 [Pseudomonas flexibilis]